MLMQRFCSSVGLMTMKSPRTHQGSSRVAALCVFMLALAACSPGASSPQERKESLQRLFERAQLRELQSRMRSEGMAAGRSAAERAGRVFPNVAGAGLAASIRYSRGQALRAGARPVPPEVMRELSLYFEPELLAKVPWNTAGRRVSLGTVLAGWYYREGAVTLGDTIVFSDERAAGRLLLWAHELTHVEQFDQLGVDGFSALYTTQWSELERRASENAHDIIRQVRAAQRESLQAPAASGEMAAGQGIR